MNKEYQYVVKPIIKYLEEEQKVNWAIYKPKYHTSATGWDIEARSKNIDLLIEAKAMGGPFISKINGLVTAPLANRKRHFPDKKKPFAVCWALGNKNITRNPFQLLWDYFVRNPKFWKHYHQDLKVKYIFIVNRGTVSRIDFGKFLSLTPQYKKLTKNATISGKREAANYLISNNFKRVYKRFYNI